MTQRFGDAEVSDFDEVLRREKYVLRLEVAMKDVLLVNVLQAKGNLHQPAQDPLLGQQLSRKILL